MPFSFLSLNHVVATYQVCLRHVGVDLCGVDVAVAEHPLNHLDGDATAEAHGCCKGVPGAVGGQVLSQLHLFTQQGQLAVVADVGAVRQAEVVLLQDVEDDRQQYDGVSLVSLLAMIVDEPMSLY